MISILLSPRPLTSRGGPGTIKDIYMEDIRKNPDVKRVVAEMRGSGEFDLDVAGCKSIVYPEITMSVAELAFFMRDKCDQFTWRHQLALSLKEEVAMSCSTPTQWILAAAKAWDSKAADAAGDAE